MTSAGMMHELTRRRFILSALGAVGAAAAGTLTIGAQTPGGRARRVDFHHHMVPPKHLEAILKLRESGRTPAWSPAMSIEQMDKNEIATAIVSLVQPGVTVGTIEQGRTLARECNEYGARMVADYPGRFGFFAAIPLTDAEGSLREIAYALDTLRADGIGLFTSFGEKYLGDKSFEPVYEELNRRSALVYVHPTQPMCCTGLVPGVTVSTIEYATDSSRTIASLTFSGTAAKYPNIRWIFSHSGGTMPFLVGRYERLASERKDAFNPNGTVLPQLRKYHYEIAQAAHPGALDALTEIIPITQILFGSDYPLWVPEVSVRDLTAYKEFNDAQRRAVNRGNAERLLPRLRS